MNRFSDWIKKHRIYSLISCLGLLGVSMGLLIYYIVGPSTAFFHADCADSLMWAQISIETGKVFSEDFYYAALLPFGANLWMIPVLRIFGYTMAAQKISMSIFAVIFVLAAFSMFRAMRWRPTASAGGALIISLILSGSAKLREIMWEHVIYYSLGILFFMLLLNLCLRLYDYIRRLKDGETGRGFFIRFALLAIALLALCIGCGSDGLPILTISVLPILGGLIAVMFFDEKIDLSFRRLFFRLIPAGIIAVGVLLGLLLFYILTKGGTIKSEYVDYCSSWVLVNQWWGNIEKTFTNYFTLFGITFKENSSLFTVSSAFTLIKLLAAVIIMVCPALLLFRYKKLQSEASRLLAWSNCFLFAVIILGHLCGRLTEGGDWRLTPVLSSGVIATLVYLKELFSEKGIERRIAGVMAVILIVTVGFNGYSILKLPNTAGDNQKYIEIAEALAEDGHDKGYATFWNAGNTTLLSDGKVKAINIAADGNGLYKRTYQTSDRWFESEPNRSSYFVILTKEEYDAINQSDYWKEVTAPDNLIDNWECEELYVFVFAENPIK